MPPWIYYLTVNKLRKAGFLILILVNTSVSRSTDPRCLASALGGARSALWRGQALWTLREQRVAG